MQVAYERALTPLHKYKLQAYLLSFTLISDAAALHAAVYFFLLILIFQTGSSPVWCQSHTPFDVYRSRCIPNLGVFQVLQ